MLKISLFTHKKVTVGVRKKVLAKKKILTANTGDTKGKRGKSTEYDG